MAANAGTGAEATTAVGETEMNRLNEVSVLTQDTAQITFRNTDARR